MPYEFRNLYPPYTDNLSGWTKESGLYRNQPIYSRNTAWGGLYTPITLDAGAYTVSFFYRTSVTRVISISLAAYGESTEGIVPYGTGPVNAQGGNEWQRLSLTFTISEQRTLYPRIENRTDESTKLYVSAPQLEVGSTMTLFEGYHSTWYIDENGELAHTDFPEIPERAFQAPLPKSVWRTRRNYNNGYPYNELMPDISYEPDPEPIVNDRLEYSVYCDGKLIHSSVTPLKEYKLIDPVLTLQDSNAGSFEFAMPKFNAGYGDIFMMASTIIVKRGDEEIWEGRPVSFREDMWLNHNVVCEGELAYLNDIFQIPYLYEDMTLFQLISAIISNYNNKCSNQARQFKVGTVPNADSSKYTTDLQKYKTSYDTTLNVLKDICNKYGLRMYVSKRLDISTNTIKRYIDFTGDESLGENSTQKIIFGKNLVDYSKSYNFANIVTALLPLGAKTTNGKSVTPGSELTPDYTYSGQAIHSVNGIVSIDVVEDQNYIIKQYQLAGENRNYVYISTRMLPNSGLYVIRIVEDGDYRYYNLKLAKTNKNSTGNQYTTLSSYKLDVRDARFNTNNAVLIVGCYGDDPSYSVKGSQMADQDAVDEFVTISTVSGQYSVADDLYCIKGADGTGSPNRPIDIYGRIEKKIEWSSVTDPMTLYSNAVNYLESDQFDGLQIELMAFDMAVLGMKNITRLRVGEYVMVEAPVYGLNKSMPIRELKIPLDKPEDMKYTVGDSRTPGLTSNSSNANDELARLIAEKPEMSSVLNAAKQAAFEQLMSQGNSYVTFEKNPDGSIRSIIVSDHEDYTQSTNGYWKWTNTGLGWIPYNSTTVKTAITNDGSIVADMITTGLLAADMVKGGTLGLGHWAYTDPITRVTRYTNGLLEVKGAGGGPVLKYGRGDAQNSDYKHGLEVFSTGNSADNPFWDDEHGTGGVNPGAWICMTNGNICFGHHDYNNSAQQGPDYVDDGFSWLERPRIFGGVSITGETPYSGIAIQVPDNGSLFLNIPKLRIQGSLPDQGGTMIDAQWAARDGYDHIQIRNQELRFLKGILMDIVSVQGGNTYTGNVDIPTGTNTVKRLVIADGLITDVQDINNQNNS